MYKTFTEWKNGNWLEDGEPRKEAYTKDELLLVEMGWKYGFDAGKAQQADRIAGLEKQVVIWEKATMDARIKSAIEKQSEPVAWMWSEDGCDLGVCLEQDKKLGKKEFAEFDIPLYTTPHHASDVKQTKPLSDEEIGEIYWKLYADAWTEEDIKFARAIEERHGIK